MSDAPDRAAETRTEGESPCRHLRTKTMFYGFAREAALSVGPECDTAHFWCVKTGRVLGPDHDLAHREQCSLGPDGVAPRECFEA